VVTLAVGAVESFRTADIHHPTERERERERESLTHSSSILFSLTGSFRFLAFSCLLILIRLFNSIRSKRGERIYMSCSPAG
jgi:hypothetical protein